MAPCAKLTTRITARTFALALAASGLLGLARNPGTSALTPPAHRPSGAAHRPTAAPAALLRASVEARKRVSYVGQFETVRFGSKGAVATIVKIEHLAPDSTRRWYVAPEALYGDYSIERGTATYDFDRRAGRLTISRNPSIDDQFARAGDFERVLQNYRAIVSGAHDTVANRLTESIVLVNKHTGERAERLWLDRETRLVLKKEEYHGNGSVAAQTRFEELRYTDAIPRDLFSTAAPRGWAQVAGVDVKMPSSDIARAIKEAGFPAIEPKNLPQGFAVQSGDVATIDNVRTLHLVYSDGLRSISLFENGAGAAADFGTVRTRSLSFEGHDAQYVEDGPTTLITWKEHDHSFALVGDLQRSELVRIAMSVVP